MIRRNDPRTAPLDYHALCDAGAAVAGGWGDPVYVEILVMKRKRRSPNPNGRPLERDRGRSFEQTRPWEKEQMSRSTWFRRRRKAREK